MPAVPRRCGQPHFAGHGYGQYQQYDQVFHEATSIFRIPAGDNLRADDFFVIRPDIRPPDIH